MLGLVWIQQESAIIFLISANYICNGRNTRIWESRNIRNIHVYSLIGIKDYFLLRMCPNIFVSPAL